MKKQSSIKPIIYPMPVVMISTYNEDGSVDVMNAAWAATSDYDQLMVSMDESHMTADNLKRNPDCCISLATSKHIAAADYVGIVSAKKVKDKFEKSGLTASKAEKVNAPMINEFPVCFECKFDFEKAGIWFFKIINLKAEEDVLDDKGNVDISRCDAVLFDQAKHRYFKVGEYVADAFKVGLSIK